MRVSVILPVYNGEKYLQETISSILGQRLTDLEVLAIDDGSTDGTAKILRRCAETDSRVRVFTQKNGGPAKARNLGIREARGEYLCFMDADDLIAPGMLEDMWNMAHSGDMDCVACGYVMDTDGHEKVFSFPDFAGPAEQFRAHFTDMLRDQLMYVVWNKLYRTALVRERGASFPDYLSGEDRLFNFQVYPYIERFGFISTPFYRYFLRGEQTLANRYVENRFDSVLACYRGLASCCEEMALCKEETRRVVNFSLIKGVVSCFTQLSARGCPMGWGQKRAYIREILSHPEVGAALKTSDGGYSRIVGAILRTKSPLLAYLMAKGIFLLQFRCQSVYLRIKYGRKKG